MELSQKTLETIRTALKWKLADAESYAKQNPDGGWSQVAVDNAREALTEFNTAMIKRADELFITR